MLLRFSEPPFWRPCVPLIRGDPPSTHEHSVSIEVANDRDTDTMFYLEPWGEIYSMAAHTVFVVQGIGPESGTFDVWQADDGITVWAWPGSWARVFYGDIEIGQPVS
jgi:hypothetical protein